MPRGRSLRSIAAIVIPGAVIAALTVVPAGQAFASDPMPIPARAAADPVPIPPKADAGKTTPVARSAAMRPATGASGAIKAGRPPGAAPRSAVTPNSNPRWAGYYYGPISVSPGYQWLEVYCPSGMLATSGGESNSSSAGVTLHGTYGLAGGYGWHVDVTNDSSSSAAVYAWVVCFSGLTGYSQPQETEPGILPGSIDYHPMYDCPAGQQVVGGGLSSDSMAIDIGEMSPLENIYIAQYTGWETQVTNTGTSNADVTSQEICASGIANYYVYDTYTAVAPGAYTSVTQACPAGRSLVGGGGDGGWPFRYTDSFPSDAGWRVWAVNAFDSATDYLYAYAICGN